MTDAVPIIELCLYASIAHLSRNYSDKDAFRLLADFEQYTENFWTEVKIRRCDWILTETKRIRSVLTNGGKLSDFDLKWIGTAIEILSARLIEYRKRINQTIE